MTATPSGYREQILAAALETFAEKGFDGATTREIAKRARANLGLIPYYFGDKEKLWRCAVERVFTEIDDLMSAVDSLDTREAGGMMIRAAVDFAARNPAFIRLMNDECKRKGPRMRWLVDRHGKPMFEKALALFDSAREAGVMREVPSLHLYYTFVGAVGMIFSQAPECVRICGRDPGTDRALIDAHADAIVALFLL